MTDEGRGRAAAAFVALVLATGLAWWLWPEEPRVGAGPVATAEPTSAAMPPAPVAPPDPCARGVERPFVPRTITVPGVTAGAAVLGLPRDAAGVVGVPPVSAKDDFAWDLGGVRPGAREGRVLLNAHTWPDGSALGNALLRDLDEGDRVVLRGRGGADACFRVFRRVEVRVEDGYPGWDRADGPHQAVIVVCSGERLGPGRWTHRTLWFALPVS